MGLNTPECRVLVDGFPIDVDPHEQVLEIMDRAIRERSTGHYISITNTETMDWCHRLAARGDYVRNADFSLCDGIGVVIAARCAGKRITRYNGPALHLDASRHGASRGWRHYYLGGTGGSAAEMARRFSARFPGMIVAGIHEPPFRPLTGAERAALIADIRASRPDIVWVGLGLPKQEAWIADLIDELQVPWMAGVGASFDFHSGRVRRAPPMLRAVGLEWVFMLALQPRLRTSRLWRSWAWMLGAIVRSVRPKTPMA